ncbi:hypothetical protein B0H10DRAFT_1846719, partial [Mycena sp. CBHHK59/15]
MEAKGGDVLADRPSGLAFLGVSKQRYGAAIVHLNSAAAAMWLRGKSQMSAFLASMGGTSIFKEHLYRVVVRFVPVSFDPEQDSALRVVEDNNNLGRGALAMARWIKPAALRHAGQRTAFAIWGFTNPQTAN